MTTEEFMGYLSGSLVTLSIFPYAWRVWRRDIIPNIFSWFIWWIAVIALLVNYKTSGAKELWPAIGSCFNVSLICIIVIIRGKWQPLKWYDYLAFALGLIAIASWIIITRPTLLHWAESYIGYLGNKQELATYALCLAIIADLCGALPTFLDYTDRPLSDRPFAWVVFSIGYGLNMFAITESTFANYVLPVYMVVMAACISYPLVRYRIKNDIPLKEWI